jgi:hypothetical protein
MTKKGSSLAMNQTLGPNDYLLSANGQFKAIMQYDGNLVVYQEPGGQVMWSSNKYPGPGPAYTLFMQYDGNLVVYQGVGGSVIWASNISPGVGQGPYTLIMQDDGNLVVYQGTGTAMFPIWDSMGMNKGDRLAMNQTLGPNDYLLSANGQFKAIMQYDGNLVVYQEPGGQVMWSSNIYPGPGPAYTLFMQYDGNLVVYQGVGGQAIWATGVASGVGPSPYTLIMQDDGNLVVYQGTGTEMVPIWASRGMNKGDRLAMNQFLGRNDFLLSNSRVFKAIMQNDANLVVYQEPGDQAFWASGVAPGVNQGSFTLVMQDDGNLVIKQWLGGSAIWASNIYPGIGQGPYTLIMQDDGNLVVYQGAGTGMQAIWASMDRRLVDDSHLQSGDVLVFVPTDATGAVIDAATGLYGYSHCGLVCGNMMYDVDNTDQPTVPQVEAVDLQASLKRVISAAPLDLVYRKLDSCAIV